MAATETGDRHTAAGSGLSALVARLSAHAGALGALAVRVAAAGVGYALQIALARLLGAEHYGAFAYAWAWLAIAGFSATFGLGQTAVRWLAHYHETADHDAGRRFIRWSLIVVGAGATALAGLAFALMITLPDLVAPAYRAPVTVMIVAVPLFALGDLAEGFARSRGRMLLALVPPYLVRPLLLVAALPVMMAAGMVPSATNAMIAAGLATGVTALAQLALALRAVMPPAGAAPRNTGAARQWLVSSLPVLASDMVQLLRQNADLLLLAAFVTPDRVAMYFAATRVAGLLGLVEFAVGAAASHRFARASEQPGGHALPALARQATHLTFWPTLVAALALVASAPQVLALFGSAYAAGAGIVTVLATAHVARAAVGPAEDLLIMRGYSSSALLAQLAGLATAVAVGTTFIPVIGAMGAALTAASALFATTVLLALSCRLSLGFWPLPLPPAAARIS